MQTSTTTLMLILSTFIPVFGIILAATPYLTPTSECFAVTIPTAQSHDHTLATYRHLYCGIMVACTAAMTAACVAAACLDPTHAFLACFIVGLLALIILGYILMLVFRAKVQHIKQERGWQAQRQRSAAIIGPDGHVPHPISMWWNLLYVPVFAVTLAIGYAGYQRMPGHIPLQVNLSGETTRTMAKSPMAIWLPLLMFGLLAAVLIFTQYVITHSKKGVDVNDPESSAYAYGLYARVERLHLGRGAHRMHARPGHGAELRRGRLTAAGNDHRIRCTDTRYRRQRDAQHCTWTERQQSPHHTTRRYGHALRR